VAKKLEIDERKKVDLGRWPTHPPGKPDADHCRLLLSEQVGLISDLQRRLLAQDKWAVLLIFQGMDASGKDSAIRAVLSGVDPAGCQVFAFKAPSAEDLDHDFLWRTARSLPERGRIGVFNRSWYEEVTAVRVEKGWLERQKLPEVRKDLWDERLDSIRHYERHLRRNGTLVLKFFLHISRDEQRRRLLARIDDQKRNWKFQPSDLDVRELWSDYQRAYEKAIGATASEEAPWFVIPADDKPWARLQVASVLRERLEGLRLGWPVISEEQKSQLAQLRTRLVGD
jgi:PPK2 family polyphosphate:nucleotide phosphotransferase